DALAISNAHVLESNAGDLSSSSLTLRADVTNDTGRAQVGTVSATVTPPGSSGTQIHLEQAVRLTPAATRTVTFAPEQYPQLRIQQPQVWWPYQMGAQALYRLSMSVSQP